ncbi:DIS3-like exonuclease 2 [Paragonimus westermani]|uniref:DIS3-like exonuclease 2 n=1 Tax=Paragonimus westermani TaxID=34504 RepID=A0A5J4ND81_9TREM|nr:DIS3-like exonuclease 2 [Paragonimus westermani]
MRAPTFTLLQKQVPFVYPLNSFVLQDPRSATPRRSRIKISRQVFHQCKPFSACEPFEALDDVKSVRQKSGGVYAPFWQESEIRAGIAKKELLTGTLRINPRQYNDAYIKHPIGDCDVYIHGLRKRNRALTNDIVAVLLEEKKFWRVFGTFVKESIEPNVEKTGRGNNALSYCTLEEFIAHQKHDLEELIGVEMVKNIVIDLNTSTDPLPPPTPSLADSTTIHSVPWWTVIQRTGRVVGIVHQLHSRTCIGYLQVTRTALKNKTACAQDVQDSQSPSSLAVMKKESASWNYANLIPSDYRLPRIIIPRSLCPEAFQVYPDSLKHVRFVAKIVDWAENSIFPKGTLLRSLSSESQNLIDSETDRILIGAGFVHGLDAINQFPESVTVSAQQAVAEATSALSEELRWRKDFREHCVFTIDPSTARDLDDALHLRDLSDDEIQLLAAEGYENAAYEVKLLLFKFHVSTSGRSTWMFMTHGYVGVSISKVYSTAVDRRDQRLALVGVHIADVSYFVRPDSPVDVEASRRATTIYLVQLCVPMLPRLLCEELCSLNPSEHKLSFSVVFKVTKQGELAMQRRHRRFASGSLRLDQVKSIFLLDDNKRFPVGVSLAVCKPSNSLVEEWMLAANEAVAKHLATHLPNSAFLRRHPAPSLNQLHNAAITLESVGIKVNTETAGSIQASICRAAGCAVDTGYHYSSDLVSMCSTMAAGLSLVEMDLIEKLEQVELNANPDPKRRSFQDRKEELEREARLLVAVSMLTKTMTLAEYFCLGELSSDSTTEHYALNMEFYTHFTSPIRRYADVIVHRQLAATLSTEALKAGDDDLAAWYAQTIPSTEVSTKELQTVAEVCNAKKLSARIASEESTELFFILFVKNMNIRSSELVAARRVANRIEETAKLCILWNTESTSSELSDATRTQTSSGEVTIDSALATAPSCGCYYTELKLLDVVLCQVSIERPEDGNLNENANQTDVQQTQVETLPKLRVCMRS